MHTWFLIDRKPDSPIDADITTVESVGDDDSLVATSP